MGFLGINKRKIEYNNTLDAKRLSRSFKAAFEGIASTYKKDPGKPFERLVGIFLCGYVVKC